MKKAVSGSGVVFGRSDFVEDGGRGLQNFASTITRVWTRGNAQCEAGDEIFRYRILDKPKISKFTINTWQLADSMWLGMCISRLPCF